MTEQEKREKVIKGLECCQECDGYTCHNYCPYYDRNEPEDQATCTCHLAHNALALLKAQESIAPVRVNRYIETDENGDWFSPETYDCGNCGVELHGKANYCHLCGRTVKWE